MQHNACIDETIVNSSQYELYCIELAKVTHDPVWSTHWIQITNINNECRIFNFFFFRIFFFYNFFLLLSSNVGFKKSRIPSQWYAICDDNNDFWLHNNNNNIGNGKYIIASHTLKKWLWINEIAIHILNYK